MDDLSGLIVPFKRKVYDEVVAAFRHLAGVTSSRIGRHCRAIGLRCRAV